MRNLGVMAKSVIERLFARTFTVPHLRADLSGMQLIFQSIAVYFRLSKQKTQAGEHLRSLACVSRMLNFRRRFTCQIIR